MAWEGRGWEGPEGLEGWEGLEGLEAWADQEDREALDSPGVRGRPVARASAAVQEAPWPGHRSAGPGRRRGARRSGSGGTTRCRISRRGLRG